MRRSRLCAALALSLFAADADAQFCPSYATCRTPATRAFNPETDALASLFDRVAQGPARYGSLGWSFPATLPDGCGLPTAAREVDAVFPCVLLKAIALTESPSWRQFCVPTAPSPGAASQTLIRSDCGYGLMGIARGMHPGETSDFDPARVASDPAYNVSVGAGLLAEAWRAMPCVGDRRVRVIEDWYFAVWAYGGLAYRNNPSNPLYRADRAPYRDPGGLSVSEYPYQEVVFGWMRTPPSPAHFAAVRVNLPRRSEICGTCGGPNANARDPDEVHPSDCPPSGDASTDATVDARADVPTIDATSDVTVDAPTRETAVADVVFDDRASPDAATEGDVTTDVTPPGGGCGCHFSPRSSGAVAWLLFGVAVLKRRRRG